MRTILLSLVLFVLPVSSNQASTCPVYGNQAVGWMKEARIQHQWWLTQELDGKVSLADMDIAGPPSYQRKWIYRYTTTIKVLKQTGCL